jgi:cytochrome c oxidase assembly protein subunit 11
MSDKFLKSLIYTLLASLLIIFFLIQPYNIYCRISKNCNPVMISALLPHKSGKEKMTINFSAEIPDNLKNIVEFYPQKNSKKIINGKNIINSYVVKNLSNHEITIRASYRILPKEADKYLDRIECLCFQNQVLAPKESAKMPINFVISSEIEKDKSVKKLNKIEVSYKIILLTI